jgi:iron complex transport system permease protein
MKKSLLILMFLSAGLFVGALFIGPKIINPFSLSPLSLKILIYIRLPRVVVSILMGAALGASGAVLQGFLRNPLADPYILGLSGGAALLATGGILLGATGFGLFTIPLLAFSGSILTGIMVGLLGYRRGMLLPERLLLAGVGLGFLFSALLMLLMSISSDEGLRRAILWIFGDLSMADWSLIPYGMVIITGGLILSIWRAKGLNALMLGDEIAHSLGFSPYRERLLLFISVGLMTAASVSLGGLVGFIGLLVPHIVRFLAGADAKVVIPFSALTGGVMLCIADTVGRTIMAPMELPSGIITAIIGAPYFLYLLRRREILGGG